jgi:two-component system, cell cycle sensor histidine kinase and response regulator CckA
MDSPALPPRLEPAPVATVLDEIADPLLGTDAEWRTTYLNRAAEALLSRSPGDVLGRPLWDVLPVVESARLRRELLARSGGPGASTHVLTLGGRGYEARVCRTARGASIQLWERPASALGGSWLPPNAERFRMLVEQSGRTLFYVHDAAGYFEYVSPSIADVLGYPAEEMIGHHYREFFADDASLRAADDRTAAALRTGRAQGPYLAHVRHRDGGARTLDLSETPVVAGDTVVGIQGVARDITESHQTAVVRDRLAAIIDAMPDLVGMADSKQRIVYVNPACLRVLGYDSLEQVAGRHVVMMYPQWAAELIEHEGAPAARRDGVWYGEGALRARDGEEIPIAQVIIAHRGTGEDDVYYSTIARDLRSQRAKDSELHVSETRFRALVEQSRAGVFIMQQGRFTYVNPRLSEIFGYSVSELLETCTIEDLVTGEHRDSVLDLLERQVAGEARDTQPLQGRRKDGTSVRIEIFANALELDGAPAVLGIVADVTDRVRLEGRLRLLSQAVEQSPVSIVITDPTGRIVYVNQRFSEVSGYSRDEAIGGKPSLLASGAQDEAFYHALWSTITAGRQWSGEIQNRRKDGTLFWEAVSITPISDPDGRLTHFLGLKEDITARRALEDQLRQAQKLEAIGRLAGGVAHDFNNVLTAIRGYAEMLLADLSVADPRHEDVTEILRACERAAALVRQLLAFSRRQHMQPRVLDANQVVRELERMLLRLIGEDVTLRTDLAPDLHSVRADAGQLEQVIVNLIVNARDALSESGSITIRTRNRSAQERDPVAVGYVPPPGDYVEITVTDTGAGIPDSMREQIFEPFFTTKEPGKGTGLGLATVYGIVVQSGGHVWVESQPGEGSSFIVLLPRWDGQSPPRAAADEQVPTGLGGTERILLVEDDISVRALARRALELAGYQVGEAIDGHVALEIVRQQEPQPDLVISDVVMPQMGGHALHARLREEYPAIRVLLMTGYDERAVPGSEGVDLLSKPFAPAELLQRVRQLLDAPSGSVGAGGQGLSQ